MNSDFLIVSSYDESCGNAYFTKALVDDISKKIQCRGIGLNIRLTQATDRSRILAADQHIKQICKELNEARRVNIQIEPQLYGTRACDVVRRLKWLLTANRNTSATLHNTRIIGPKAPLGNILNAIIRARLFLTIRIVRTYLREKQQIKTNHLIIETCKKLDCPIIVHTQRAKEDLEFIFNINNIFLHPLKFPIVTDSNKFTGTRDLKIIKHSLGLSENTISIGMFGYISAYKGHEDALHALKFLPKNYHLFIFGRQHPSSIRKDGGIDPYLERLILLTQNEGLTERVHFMGEHEPEQFARFISAVDVCWLPYREVGQDGSGIASQCFDNANRTICSASLAFDENLKLEPREHIIRFDIGNYLQLANATLIAIKDQRYLNVKLDRIYTIETQTDLYLTADARKNKIANN